MDDPASPLERLLARLDLEETGPDRFASAASGGMRRLFGGLIAAQCAVAAMRTVEAGRLHALHGFFLRAGRGGAGLHFDVTRTRDGRSFTARRVVAVQGDDAIFECLASFTTHADAIEHAAEPALDDALAAGPEGLPDWESVRSAETGEPPRGPDAIEVRVVRPEDDRPDAAPPASRCVWMRVRGALPEDPRVHAAVLVYASDRTLLRTAARLHGGMRSRIPASLDHAVWLHRAPRLDGWWVYASETPIAAEARALVHGRMLTPDGVRFASVAQEGLLRRKKPSDV